MKSVSINSPKFLEASRKPTGLEAIARRVVRARLGSLLKGQVVISEHGRHETFGAVTDDLPLTVHLSIHDPRFYSDIAFGGAAIYFQPPITLNDSTNTVRNVKSGFSGST